MGEDGGMVWPESSEYEGEMAGVIPPGYGGWAGC